MKEEGIDVENVLDAENGEKYDTSGFDPGLEFDAHHIFPQKFKAYFKLMGINVDNPEFGVWLDKHIHRQNADSYNKLWFKFFEKYDFDEKLISKLSLLDAFQYIEDIGRIWWHANKIS